MFKNKGQSIDTTQLTCVQKQGQSIDTKQLTCVQKQRSVNRYNTTNMCSKTKGSQ